MSNIKDYTTTCNEVANDKAQGLRKVADVLADSSVLACGNNEIHKTILRGCSLATKRMATDMENLVRQMADQLDQERAEVERMKRLYEMARKDIQDLKSGDGYDPNFHRMQSDGSY